MALIRLPSNTTMAIETGGSIFILGYPLGFSHFIDTPIWKSGCIAFATSSRTVEETALSAAGVVIDATTRARNVRRTCRHAWRRPTISPKVVRSGSMQTQRGGSASMRQGQISRRHKVANPMKIVEPRSDTCTDRDARVSEIMEVGVCESTNRLGTEVLPFRWQSGGNCPIL